VPLRIVPAGGESRSPRPSAPVAALPVIQFEVKGRSALFGGSLRKCRVSGEVVPAGEVATTYLLRLSERVASLLESWADEEITLEAAAQQVLVSIQSAMEYHEATVCVRLKVSDAVYLSAVIDSTDFFAGGGQCPAA